MAKSYTHQVSHLLTAVHEDYLKNIYQLQRRHGVVTNALLAETMGVRPASATNMVKKLAEFKLVEHMPYQGVVLTHAGELVALEVLRHHRLVELYLHETLGIPWEEVHAEADRLEHVISERLADAIAASLGDPLFDPHGDPIPAKNGNIAPQQGRPLSQAAVGRRYRLVRVTLQASDRLAYLGSLGLFPGTLLWLRARAPFAGPLLIEVEGAEHALADEMAAALYVVLDETQP